MKIFQINLLSMGNLLPNRLSIDSEYIWNIFINMSERYSTKWNIKIPQYEKKSFMKCSIYFICPIIHQISN